jgi:uncharacterized protein YpbB
MNMADFKLHYYLLANNSKVHRYATSHSSSNMVTLVAADIKTRTSQQVAVKLSLESLILGSLFPYQVHKFVEASFQHYVHIQDLI